MNLKLFIKVDSDICLLRRIARDMNERGRSLESISEQYKATVKPMRENISTSISTRRMLLLCAAE